MAESEKNPESFWNKRARAFPRYSGLEDSYEVGMLNLARQNGVVFKGRHVLDVGCGSGLYAIGLALEAREVTALDISPEMLSALKAEAEKWQLKNIKFIRGDWLDFTTEKKYDIVFCSMNPAVRFEPSREKLLEYSRDDVVYIGGRKPMKSNVAAGLYQRYGFEPQALVDAPEMRAWLDKKGMACRCLPVSGCWKVSLTFEEITENCVNTLNNHGISPDLSWLAEYLRQYKTLGGLYLETIAYELEMILFKSRK